MQVCVSCFLTAQLAARQVRLEALRAELAAAEEVVANLRRMIAEAERAP